MFQAHLPLLNIISLGSNKGACMCFLHVMTTTLQNLQVMLNACTMQEICERKVIQRKIKCCIPVSRNVTIGYYAGYCMGDSLLRAKPGNSAKVGIPFAEKFEKESELLLVGKNIGVCWNVDYSDIMDWCCQRRTRIVALCDTEIISWIFLLGFANQLVKM